MKSPPALGPSTLPFSLSVKLVSINGSFLTRPTTEAAAQHWQQGLDAHQQTSARLVTDISTSLAEHHDRFRDNSDALLGALRDSQQQLANSSASTLEALADRFQSASEQSLHQWQQQQDEQQQVARQLLEQTREQQQQLAGEQQQQLTRITDQFQHSVQQAAEQWQQHGEQQQASGSALIGELRETLQQHQQHFQQGTTTLLQGQREGLDQLVAGIRDELQALPPTDPSVDKLVEEIIGRVADKWTMLLIEILTETEVCRFKELSRACPGISQKMLTQTLRRMEREGLVLRTVFPEVPPRVEYALSDLGFELGEAFCGVWHWAEANIGKIEEARASYDARR